MATLLGPLTHQEVVARLDEITDDDQSWYLVGIKMPHSYYVAIFPAAECGDNHPHQVAKWLREAMAEGPRDGFLLPGMEVCAGWTVAWAPQFDCAAHDTFKWDVIAERLEAAEALDDEESDDQRIKQLYLGSILGIAPSGQVRAPWSSAPRCQLCDGMGKLRNVLGDAARHHLAEHARALLTARNRDKGLHYGEWSDEDKAKASGLDAQLKWGAEWLTCPFCNGDGSRARVEDQAFMEYLEEKASEINAFITGSEGDGCDVMIAKICPQLEHDTDTDEDEEDEEAGEG